VVLWDVCDCISARYYALLIREKVSALGNITVIGLPACYLSLLEHYLKTGYVIMGNTW
jgi:hypothetical protein